MLLEIFRNFSIFTNRSISAEILEGPILAIDLSIPSTVCSNSLLKVFLTSYFVFVVQLLNTISSLSKNAFLAAEDNILDIVKFIHSSPCYFVPEIVKTLRAAVNTSPTASTTA